MTRLPAQPQRDVGTVSTRGPRATVRKWNARERKMLQLRVRACGQQWQQVVRHKMLRHVSADAARARWRRQRQAHERCARPASKSKAASPHARSKAGKAAGAPAQTVTVAQEMAALAGCAAPEAAGMGAAALLEIVSGMPRIPREERPGAAATERRRLKLAVRAADATAEARVEDGLEGRRRLQQYSSNWVLTESGDGSTPLICNVNKAEERVRKMIRREALARGEPMDEVEVREAAFERKLTVAERDALELVVYLRHGGGALPAILQSGFGRLVVGGSGRQLRTVTERELLALFGLEAVKGAGHETVEAAMRATIARKEDRWDAVADGIFFPTARRVMEVAQQRAGAVRRLQRVALAAPTRYGSMYAGAMDTLGLALRAVAGQADCGWVAEKDVERRAAVTRLHAPRAEYVDARKVGCNRGCMKQLGGRDDIVTASWPCADVSAAQRGAGAKKGRARKWRERQAKAVRAMQHAVGAVGKVASQIRRPRVLVIEQTVGILTHHRPLLRWLCAQLRRMPYTWEAALWNATDDGAAHNRNRIFMIGTCKVGNE